MFECGFKSVKVVSTELEMPEIILGILWALPLIVIRDSVQWSSILQIISRDDADDMRVRPHNHPGVSHRNSSPPVVGDNAGYVIDPVIEIEA